MEPISGGGVSVKSLFQLLALVGINQAQVAQLLHVPRPNVNLWARGHKAMPRKHLEAIERFTWEAVARKNDAYWEAMDAVTGKGPGYPLGDVAYEPLMFKPPPPDSPPAVHQWWDFHVKVLQLMQDWEVELHQARHEARTKALIRELGKLAVAEDDKLDAMITGPDRHQLLACVSELHTLLEGLDRIDARPIATRLRTALLPR
jgi:DNA-binding transcriptional regulator YdaS (Cro superfamily)